MDAASAVWRVRRQHPCARDLQRALGCSLVTANLLAHRGFVSEPEARAFLNPNFETLADPLKLPDALPAVRRIMCALDRGERIYVFGDYDGDGITAAALLTRLLERLGGDVQVHIPHRHHEGYDLREHVVEAARAAGARLIVTADCGIQRYQEVASARAANIDVIVTDHHEPGPRLPDALAVVNPHRRDSAYPFQHLAGVGVTFRLGEALVQAIGLPVSKYRSAFAELAAIGTITDIMPLLGDNRVFVKAGLEQMSSTRRRGIRALLKATGIGDRPVTSHDVGFVIGPRLNAVGRVDDPRKALDLLLTRADEEAEALAMELERANHDRRDEEQRILNAAIERILTHNLHREPAILLDAADWHPGVIGIVANRLAERFWRPTLLISMDDQTGVGRGSARSIPSFHILDALERCAEYFMEFGGHAHAAGFTIAADMVQPLREAFLAVARSTIQPEDLQPVLDIDAELPPHCVTRELLSELSMLQPFGHDNEEPVFAAFGVQVRDHRRVGRDRNHLKLWLSSSLERPVEAVLWCGGEWDDILTRDTCIDIVYKARMNRFNGVETPQLHLLALRPSSRSRRKVTSDEGQHGVC